MVEFIVRTVPILQACGFRQPMYELEPRACTAINMPLRKTIHADESRIVTMVVVYPMNTTSVGGCIFRVVIGINQIQLDGERVWAVFRFTGVLTLCHLDRGSGVWL